MNRVLTFNVVASLAFIAVGAFLALGLPQLTDDPLILCLAWAPFIVFSPTFWSLVHEGVHATLLPNRKRNDALSRALAIVFGSPLAMLRFGHLTHHWAYNEAERNPPPPRPQASRLVKTPLYYFGIFGGVYVGEVIAPVLAWLPTRLIFSLGEKVSGIHESASEKVIKRLEKRLLSGPTLWQVRLDSLLVLALYVPAFMLYGAQWWVLLLALLLRGALVSFMDNIYHHRDPGTPHRTLNLAMPSWASGAILNANLHAVHHRLPGLPWYRLKDAIDEDKDGPPRPFLDAAKDQVMIPL